MHGVLHELKWLSLEYTIYTCLSSMYVPIRPQIVIRARWTGASPPALRMMDFHLLMLSGVMYLSLDVWTH